MMPVGQLNPKSESQIEAALEEIFSSPEKVKEKGQNAARLVADRFSWDKTILPLVDFLNNPTTRIETKPLKGPIASRSSFLNPGGRSIDVPLSSSQSHLSQSFVIPAENIKTLEIPISLVSKADTFAIEKVNLAIHTEQGGRVCSKSITGVELANLNRLAIDFPIHRLPKGGKRYTLKVEYQGNDHGELSLRGLPKSCYPFVKNESGFSAQSLLDADARAEALGISFIPGTGRVYRVKSLAERALWMVRTGQFERLFRAGVRRLPQVVEKVKERALG